MFQVLRKLFLLAQNVRWLVCPSPVMKQHRDLMRELAGCHSGKPALVIGNGPSLNLQDLSKIDRFISFGANSFFLKSLKTGIHPDFLTVEDPLPAEDNAEELSSFLHSRKIAPFDLRYVFGDSAGYTYLNFVRAYRPLVGRWFPRFANDGSLALFWGGTVIYMNLQLAAHMGCNPIYLTGMDLAYDIPQSAEINGDIITSADDDPNHFDPTYFGKGKRWHLPHTAVMQHCVAYAYKALKRKGFDLYNLTEGGNLMGVPRQSFDDVVEKYPVLVKKS